MRLVFLGPPGAGKGTQAVRLAMAQGIPHVATGDILRAAVASGTEFGLAARRYMDGGLLVPDALVVGLVRERVAEADCESGFVLDGFPRTVPQAEALDAILDQLGRPLERAVLLVVADGELVNRLTGRRSCPGCGASYHVVFQAPQRADVCDACGGQLVRRDDDSEATVRRRLEVYRERTEPLTRYYRELGKLREVDGTGGVDEVAARVRLAISPACR